MSLPRYVHYLTIDDYLIGEIQADNRHEYVDGQIYAMAGASERHNRIALNAAVILRLAASGKQCGVFISHIKLRITDRNIFYYPDVMVTCQSDDNAELYKCFPCLLIGVHSHTTQAIDRREKFLAYRQIPSLRYYLMIESKYRYVEYFTRLSSDSLWSQATLDPEEKLMIDCFPLRAIFTLDDFYEDVSLN